MLFNNRIKYFFIKINKKIYYKMSENGYSKAYHLCYNFFISKYVLVTYLNSHEIYKIFTILLKKEYHV